MRRRRIRRVAVAASVILLLVTGFVVALWPVYVSPTVDQPQRADAIVVLGGAHDGREELGLKLAKEGYAPQVVFSNPYRVSPLMNRICHGGYSFRVSCFPPEPATTRGEAKEIAKLAATEKWERVIVVTFTPHISRAKYIIGKCFDGDLAVVDSRPHVSPLRWAYNYVYQSFGYVRAFFETC